MLTIPQYGFYVYTLSTPSDAIFYVGKGCGKRVFGHEKEAKTNCECYKCRKIRKIWRQGQQIKLAIIFVTEDEQEALDYEARLIDSIGLANLTNVDPGGGPAARGIKFPNKSFVECSEREYIEYLNSISWLTAHERQEKLLFWRVKKVDHLKGLWRTARQRHWDERAETLMQQIEALSIQLGWYDQERFSRKDF
jgi:hypothetical protein